MGCTKLLIDIGSTFTKAVAVDFSRERILARGKAPTTVGDDVTIGLRQALTVIEDQIGAPDGAEILACSSAAGGLRMVAIGLVPELSAEAATRAALGAGAKMVGHFSYRIGRREIEQIEQMAPDIILLAGGTDGGNEAVIVHNARVLASSRVSAPIIVAGNKCVYDQIEDIFHQSCSPVTFVDNVMPEIGRLEVQPCREAIREVFMQNIVRAKGLDRASEIANSVIMPTPAAVLKAAMLLSTGTAEEPGLGEIVVVDVGGATTDVYSLAHGTPTHGAVSVRGLPEPFAKRTVEGDLGVRHNIDTLVSICRQKKIELDEGIASDFRSDPSRLPVTPREMVVDAALARVAVGTSFERHVGKLETIYGPHGQVLMQTGKDLSHLRAVIGTGGPIAYSPDARGILAAVLADSASPALLKPKEANFFLDQEYVLYAAGLLASSAPDAALRLMKKSLVPVGEPS